MIVCECLYVFKYGLELFVESVIASLPYGKLIILIDLLRARRRVFRVRRLRMQCVWRAGRGGLSIKSDQRCVCPAPAENVLVLF